MIIYTHGFALLFFATMFLISFIGVLLAPVYKDAEMCKQFLAGVTVFGIIETILFLLL